MLSLPPSSRRLRGATVLAFALFAGACAGSDPPGVSVEAVASDLVFGVDAATPVANFDPPGATDPSSVQRDAELPDQVFEDLPGFDDREFPRPPLRTETACPGAAINEFPDKGAPLWNAEEKKEPPVAGLYRWKRSGTFEGGEGGLGQTFQVDGFERRLIRNVKVESNVADEETGANELLYTYEMVQPELTTGLTVVTTYQVKSNGQSRTVFSPADNTQVRTGEPERGLVIKKIETFDSAGAVVANFEPSIGLLIFPLPVVPGDSWTAGVVDPRTRENVQITGKLIGRDRVDACGQLVEGWRVEATVTRSGGEETTARTYEYMVAPQYGNILIFEHIKDEAQGAAQDVTFSLAQQDPDPLPTDKSQS